MEEQINQDLKEAMKTKDTVKMETLRMVKTAFMEAKTKKDAKEFNPVDIISKMVKTRNDTANVYNTAGRVDLANKEYAEASILSAYLPEVISSQLLDELADLVISSNHYDKSRMGVMISTLKNVITNRKLQCDGKTVADLIKLKLNTHAG